MTYIGIKGLVSPSFLLDHQFFSLPQQTLPQEDPKSRTHATTALSALEVNRDSMGSIAYARLVRRSGGIMVNVA